MTAKKQKSVTIVAAYDVAVGTKKKSHPRTPLPHAKATAADLLKETKADTFGRGVKRPALKRIVARRCDIAELSSLVDRLADAPRRSTADALRKEILDGFYGRSIDRPSPSADLSVPSASIFELADMPAAKVVPEIKAGLRRVQVAGLAAALQLTANEVAKKLGVSPSTLNAQLKRGRRRLSPDLSEKYLRAARIHNAARKIFTTDQAASFWLKQPVTAMGGVAPIDFLDTETGVREVESILMGLAHGNVL